MAYDSAIVSFTTKTNKVDLVDAAHINTVQAEIVIIETILGVGVKGNRADLKTRLANALDTDGSLLSGTSYPSPALPSQPFYRTDTDTFFIRNAANTSWGQVSGLTNVQKFTSGGTFTAPSGITTVYLTLVGAGGGGSKGTGANNPGGGGGGGGCLIDYPYTVTPGNNYTVTINAGGTAGTAGDGGAGGTTVFDAVTVGGGAGGVSSGGVGGKSGAAAGGASGGTTAGFGVGMDGASKSGTANGGGGGGSCVGSGGAGSSNTTAASNAAANSGGGGGGGGANGASAGDGGAGGSGICIVRW